MSQYIITKRNIVFTGKSGPIAIALDIDRERAAVHERMVCDMIDAGKSLQTVIETMNDKGDLTDAEWATLLYTLGYHQGRTGQ